MDIYVARQPIFDRKLNVFAYELLYRKDEKNYFDQSVESNVATSLLLMNSYFNFGLDNLVGDEKAFINFDKDLIKQDIPELLDPTKVVVELLEDIVPDKEFIYKVKELKKKNYIIAIDDFVDDYEFIELVKLSDIIKVDFFENTKEQIEHIVETWRPRGKILLAEKVETQEVFQWAKKLGFSLFQGYFFSKPSMMKEKGISASTYQYIKIMKEIEKEEPDYKAISKIIETDISLTYKLLKLVNSNFVEKNYVSSIQHGLAILGVNAFKKWLSLAMVQNMANSKPSALIKEAMFRGKFMEQIVREIPALRRSNEEVMFIGILSVLDALLEKSVEDIVEQLPLNQEVCATLLKQESRYLDIYLEVLAYERSSFEISEKMKEKGFTMKQFYGFYLEAIKYAEDMYNRMLENIDS